MSVKSQLTFKTLLGKIIHLLDQEIRKMELGFCIGTTIPHSILVHYLLAVEIYI